MNYGFAAFAMIVAMCVLIVFMLAMALFRDSYKGARYSGKLLLIILPVYQMILFLCFFVAFGHKSLRILLVGLMIIVFSWVIDIIIVRSLDKLEEKRRLEERLARLYAQRQLELDFYAMNRVNVEKMDFLKNRLLQQISQAETLVEQNRGFREARLVLDEACQDIQKTQLYKFCENPLVNSILSIKYKGAQEKGIHIEFCVCVRREISIDPVDLCSLFCNLIDNAIEACERIRANSLRREIFVKADCRSGCLVLQVKNASDTIWRKSQGRLLTVKREEEEHGLGLKLVERIVKKYQGELYMEQKGDFVIVDAILNLACGEETVLTGWSRIGLAEEAAYV